MSGCRRIGTAAACIELAGGDDDKRSFANADIRDVTKRRADHPASLLAAKPASRSVAQTGKVPLSGEPDLENG